jgi:hypothetical protein
MTGRYAVGRKAYGECARSGRRMLLRYMVEDPRTGLLVDPAWAERSDPRPPTDLDDGIALFRPAPDLDQSQIAVTVRIGRMINLDTGDMMRPLAMICDFDNPLPLVGGSPSVSPRLDFSKSTNSQYIGLGP